MTTCIKCHRPLKRPTETGMGRVCAAKFAKPIEPAELDLFGYDIEKAAQAAMQRLHIHIEAMAAEARASLRQAFKQASARAGALTL